MSQAVAATKSGALMSLDAGLWNEIVTTISSLIEEGTFIASPNGLTLKALDPSRIAMVCLDLPLPSLKKYECQQKTCFSVDFSEVRGVVKRGRKGEELVIRIMDGRIVHEYTTIGKRRTFRTPLIDCRQESFDPKFSFTASFQVPTLSLSNAVADASLMDRYACLSVDEGSVKLTASGERGEVEIDLTPDVLVCEVSMPAKANYNMSYIKKFLSSPSLSAVAKVSLSSKSPLEIALNLDGGGSLKLYLAPWEEMDGDV
ncbi:MAG: hypothetical protein QXS54_05230 [Candidatus Methanomethylicaceae archaeon]